MPLAQRFLLPGGMTRLAGPDEASCVIEACGVIVYCKGWCHRHYYRNLRHGDPLVFLVVQKFDRYDEHGARWCTRCKEFLSPDQFSPQQDLVSRMSVSSPVPTHESKIPGPAERHLSRVLVAPKGGSRS